MIPRIAALLALTPLACTVATVPDEPAPQGGPVAAFVADDVPAKDAPGKPLATFSGRADRNSVNLTEKGVTFPFSTKKGKFEKVKWAAALGTRAYGGPVVYGDRVFVGTNNEKPRDPKVKGDHGVMMCFKASTGEFQWQHAYEVLDGANNAPHEGIASAPWCEGNHLWYANNRGEIVCSDLDGKVAWKYDMVKEHDVFIGQLVYTSPVVVGDLVYALTSNGVDAGNGKLEKPKAPSLVAVNKKTGKFAWADASPGKNVIRGQWSAPAAAKIGGVMQVIYGGGDGYLYGLDAAKGTVLWKFNCNPKTVTPYKAGGGGTQSFIIAAPVVHDGLVYIATGQEPDDGDGVGHLWCIDPTKKGKAGDLSAAGDDLDPKSPANKDSGLVWHFGGLKSPKPPAGEREFVFGRTLSTVAVHDGIVYAAEFAGFLHALDAKTGKSHWVHDFEENTWCSPYYVDGRVYIGMDSGDFYAFEAGKTLKLVGKVQVGSGIKMPPVVADGVLYVNASTVLYAIK